MSDIKNLKTLGEGNTKYDFKEPDSGLLETFENQHKKSWYLIPIKAFEFTSLCPVTKQPDFAEIYINYIPDKLCVESKSLKLYLFSFRNSGEFMEDITNRIANDLYKLVDPLYIEVYAKFNSRGGISLTPFVQHFKSILSVADRFRIKRIIERYNQII